MLLICRIFLPRVPIVSSYHTNIALYAKMFGFGALFHPIWATHRLYHGSSKAILCPSHSTKEELVSNGFVSDVVKVWSRGVDLEMFNPLRRSLEMRDSWLVSLSKTSSSSSASGVAGGHLEFNHRRPSDVDEGVHFGLEIPSSKTVLLYVGRISWEKNLRVLVSAYRSMNHELFHLVIVGDGPARQTIKNELQHTDVSFTGYLKGETLAAAYASADVFVFPSVSETFGQVVLEAQASGLPVVAMRAEGVKEIVQDGISGILVEPEAPSETPEMNETIVAARFRAAIEEIAETPGILQTMSKQAVVRAKTFTWDAAMKTCVKAYKKATE